MSKKPKTIMVFMGGWSSERDVSLISGKAVCDALTAKKYHVLPFDVPRDISKISQALTNEQPDVVFNALHGVGGEDGVIQSVLNIADVAYTHSDVTASALCMNKLLSKKIVSRVNIPVAADRVVSSQQLKKKGHPLPPPYVLKPVAGGSSVGVYIIYGDDELNTALPNITDDMIMAERFIGGRELTVSVIDYKIGKDPKALCVTELTSANNFYDYEAKYTDGITTHTIDPELPEGVTDDMMDMALKAHTILGCAGVSRTDFRYNTTDGIIYLETNTQPGLTPLSLLPEQAVHKGIEFNDLIEGLVNYAYDTHHTKTD